jgi:hypothetical protein
MQFITASIHSTKKECEKNYDDENQPQDNIQFHLPSLVSGYGGDGFIGSGDT